MLGEVIHGYRVDSALSSDKGGFGDVFFAVHVDSGAEAVVKVLKPEMSAQRDIVARFFNEARAAASVHHPGVVQIHNVGYHGDRAYLLMERLRGDDLEGRLAAGPLPVDRALLFMRQAAGAIGAAHDRGIVHRDLKPANLFIVADPDVVGGERVKVLDFGIAKLTADAGAGKTQGVFGTPPYMSPEQCASTGAVDGRADLYSLGCILYELVCGRPPFGQGGIELIAAHLRDTPQPPRALAPWLSPAIEQVILRLLEKQPERRYPSCAALIAALDEAAAASGLPATGAYAAAGASQPWLAETTVPGSLPPGASAQLHSLAQRQPHPTTLGSAAGAMTGQPTAARGRGLWLGLAAVVVVVGAVVAVVALPRHRGPEVAGGSGGSAGGGGGAALADAGAAPADATQVAHGPTDAAQVAAVVTEPNDTSEDDPAGSGSDHRATGGRRPRTGSAAQYTVTANDAARATQLYEAGKDALLADHYDEAVRLLQQSVAFDPQVRAFIALGTAQLQRGRLDEAETALHAALLASPTKAQIKRIEWLRDKLRQEAKNQGLTLHSVSDRADPSSASDDGAGSAAAGAGGGSAQLEALVAQGDAAMTARRTDDALGLFRRAYEITPRADLLFKIGSAEYQLGRCAEARRTLQRIAPIWPGDPAVAKAKELLERIGPCS